MKITYSEGADALYISLAPARGRPVTRKLAPGVFMDVDAKERPVGIEVLNASTRYTKAELHALESPVEWLTLAEAEDAAAKQGDTISAVTIRGLLLTGQLEGRKIGKTWQVPRHAIATYLANRPKRGPVPRLAAPPEEGSKADRRYGRALDRVRNDGFEEPAPTTRRHRRDGAAPVEAKTIKAAGRIPASKKAAR